MSAFEFKYILVVFNFPLYICIFAGIFPALPLEVCRQQDYPKWKNFFWETPNRYVTFRPFGRSIKSRKHDFTIPTIAVLFLFQKKRVRKNSRPQNNEHLRKRNAESSWTVSRLQRLPCQTGQTGAPLLARYRDTKNEIFQTASAKTQIITTIRIFQCWISMKAGMIWQTMFK